MPILPKGGAARSWVKNTGPLMRTRLLRPAAHRKTQIAAGWYGFRTFAAASRRHAYITLTIMLLRLVSLAHVPRIIAIERLPVAGVFVGQ